jgi:flavin reductase (DIM6/NTAB) family NADH-FMN oxidoreductase RutF
VTSVLETGPAGPTPVGPLMVDGGVASGAAAGEPGLEAAACLRLYRRLAAGVTVITSREGDCPVGMTATSVTSLSLRPPLLLACLKHGSRTLKALRSQRAFAVHLLRADQHGHAQAFARPTAEPGGRFAGVRWSEVFGVPVLAGTLAWSVCFVVDERSYGDHSVVVGEMVAAHVGDAASPLMWHDRSYWELAPASGMD